MIIPYKADNVKHMKRKRVCQFRRSAGTFADDRQTVHMALKKHPLKSSPFAILTGENKNAERSYAPHFKYSCLLRQIKIHYSIYQMTNSKSNSGNDRYYILSVKRKKDKCKARRKRQE